MKYIWFEFSQFVHLTQKSAVLQNVTGLTEPQIYLLKKNGQTRIFYGNKNGYVWHCVYLCPPLDIIVAL